MALGARRMHSGALLAASRWRTRWCSPPSRPLRPPGRRSGALGAAARLARVQSASTIEDSEDVTWHIF
jgi:hypothetical protein